MLQSCTKIVHYYNTKLYPFIYISQLILCTSIIYNMCGNWETIFNLFCFQKMDIMGTHGVAGEDKFKSDCMSLYIIKIKSDYVDSIP